MINIPSPHSVVRVAYVVTFFSSISLVPRGLYLCSPYNQNSHASMSVWSVLMTVESVITGRWTIISCRRGAGDIRQLANTSLSQRDPTGLWVCVMASDTGCDWRGGPSPAGVKPPSPFDACSYRRTSDRTTSWYGGCGVSLASRRHLLYVTSCLDSRQRTNAVPGSASLVSTAAGLADTV